MMEATKIRRGDLYLNNIVFAEGLCFYKLFCAFVIGGVLGDLIETIFCKIRTKKWMRRSSFVYGHLSVVWGFAFVIATILFYKVGDRNSFSIFLIGTLLGGIYEYFCSLFTEYLMGAKFWDYSQIPCNIAGRINLVYCTFWGFATVLWMNIVFPLLNYLIEKIPVYHGTFICNILLLCILNDAVISFMAIKRYIIRNTKSCNTSRFWMAFDKIYSDQRIEKIYENLKICNLKENETDSNRLSFS